jgi:hypothetical protein
MHTFLQRGPEGNRLLDRPKCSGNDNIKMHLEAGECRGGEWIQLIQEGQDPGAGCCDP